MAEPRDSILGGDGCQAGGDASSSAARSGAPTWRSAVLSLLKACSMGKKSGEQAGRNRSPTSSCG
ncbi:MAG: hypothetical protein K0R44_990 [Thermomicrobiales bacterium]|nr:hypothetical protein [Thermomicrobiales bacterium]